jgi:ribosomal protein L37AE/L43A
MKCRQCKKKIHQYEIYSDFYYCDHCKVTLNLGNWAKEGIKSELILRSGLRLLKR